MVQESLAGTVGGEHGVGYHQVDVRDVRVGVGGLGLDKEAQPGQLHRPQVNVHPVEVVAEDQICDLRLSIFDWVARFVTRNRPTMLKRIQVHLLEDLEGVVAEVHSPAGGVNEANLGHWLRLAAG